MAVASGVYKKLIVKKETAWGADAPARTGAQYLRRRTSDISLQKDTYQSQEIRSDFQIADFRHGIRSVQGTIAGELSPLTYKQFFAAALRAEGGNWTAPGASVSVSYTLVAASGSEPSHALRTGDWRSGGIREGEIVRFVGVSPSSMASRDFLVIGFDSGGTKMYGYFIDGTAVVAATGGTSVTRHGYSIIVPSSNHSDLSFAIEHWHSDLSLSELFLGCKISQLSMNFAPNGMSEVNFQLMGKNIADVSVGRGGITEDTQYFTTPTAETSNGVVAGVNGIVGIGGKKIGSLTGLSISLEPSMSVDSVVGSNVYPGIAPGRVNVTGQLTAILEDFTMRDYFVAESEVSIVAGFNAGSESIAITLPRVKLGGVSKDDGEKSIIQTVPFQALLQSGTEATTGKRNTTMMIVDTGVTSA